jgi:hypothetical protein
MDDVLVVRRREPGRDLRSVVERLAQWEGARLDLRAHGLAFEKLEHREGDVAFRAEIMNGEDVRVRERRDRFGFAFEAGETIGIAREFLRKHLDGHVATETRVARAEHFAHASGAERREDFVGTEPEALGQSHCPTLTGEVMNDRRRSSPRRSLESRFSRPVWSGSWYICTMIT